MSLKNILLKAASKISFTKHVTSLKAGDKAPPVKGLDEHGKPFDTNSLKGKKVVLYFYPKDDTPGCTNQACSLRDNYKMLQKKGFTIIGVSADSPKKHLKFIAKYKLPFTLISDENLELIKACDVWGKKQFMGKTYDGIIRTTFVINEKGMIEEVISKVDTKGHAGQVIG
jgi:peroxiredoxin Q/BCP